jgi:zinc protease
MLAPALPESEIELQRMQLLGRLKQEQSNPDGMLRLLGRQSMYRGHPYEHRAIGTIETVTALKRDQLVPHLAKLRETSRLLLAVVGDVDAKRVLDTTRRLFGALPRGTYRATVTPAWKSEKGEVTVVEQKLPTTYILAAFPGPSPRDPEWPVAHVAMSTLAHRVFEEVRTKRNLSYAPGAWFWGGTPVTNGGLYVTAVDPKTTMKVMLDEAKKLRDEPISAAELAGTKAQFLTDMYSGRQAPSDQGYALAVAQLYAGDWRKDRTLIDVVKAVTAEQVQAWAKKSVTRLRAVVIGDMSKLDIPALEQF